jgi:hypothetical protein
MVRAKVRASIVNDAACKDRMMLSSASRKINAMVSLAMLSVSLFNNYFPCHTFMALSAEDVTMKFIGACLWRHDG